MNQLTTTMQPTEMMYGGGEPPSMGISDYIEILKRRAGIMLLVTALVSVIAAVVAVALPAVYRSTAVILVEEQSIPEEFIKSTITTFADERIQVISQRVLTRTTLLQLVEKYDLYPSERRSETNDEILERMRKDIRFTPISADRGRSGGRVTIAFNIAYVSESPQKAQRVVNELVSLFLNENVRVRQQRTAETSAFLGEEAKRLATQLQEMEAKLAAFRARNANALPESSQVNNQLAERNDSELMRVDRELRMLDDRRNFLQTQLSIVPPNLAPREMVTASGERVASAADPAERLRLLRIQQTTLSGSYSEAHPDMRRLAREIAVLEKEIKESGDSGGGPASAAGADDQSKELAALRAKLREARERYSETHPDVLKLQKAISALERAAPVGRTAAAPASAPAGQGGAATARKPDNPAYLQLLASIEQTNSEARALASSRQEMRQRQRVFAARLEAAPDVQREYLDLVRDYDNSLTKYRDIKGKELEAQVAEELEKDRKGERFSLLEPAQLPERPFKPDRTIIMFIGLMLAVAAGLGAGALREALDFSIKGPRDLARKVALPILAQVPYLPSAEDADRRKTLKWIYLVGAVLFLVLLVLAIHFFVTPLGTLIYSFG
jgi:polysaccharide biosynthesis transport protein